MNTSIFFFIYRRNTNYSKLKLIRVRVVYIRSMAYAHQSYHMCYYLNTTQIIIILVYALVHYKLRVIQYNISHLNKLETATVWYLIKTRRKIGTLYFAKLCYESQRCRTTGIIIIIIITHTYVSTYGIPPLNSKNLFV